ncbi:helix-turn-helix domain-containing protein [Paenibacillus sp. GCM10027626]|uniref:helix-turn-helix domain-containing protein n=1 Tax=Paenibacillus sp. GCM10027626 TaxID=3273411 RepID=UPI003636B0E4
MLKARRSVFLTILMSYLCILLIPVIIGSVFYQRVEAQTIENANRTNLGLLEQAKAVTETQMESIDKMTNYLALYPKLQWLLSNGADKSPEDMVKLIDFMKDLQKYRNVSSFDSNFYIFVKESDLIFTPIAKTDSRTFYTQLHTYKGRSYDWIMEHYFQGLRYKNYFPVETTETLGETPVQTITYVQSLPINDQSDIKGYLVINIDEREIRRLFQQIEQLHQGEVYIINERNEVLTSTAKANAWDSGLLQRLDHSSGYTQIERDGQEMIVSYTTGENDWKYVSLVPKPVVMGNVEELKTRAIVLLMICLLAGFAVAYLLAYRNYSPIRDVVHTILHRRSDQANAVNEYDFIKQSVIRSMEEERQLRDTIARNAPVIRANFLTRLIKGHVDAEAMTDESLAFMDVRLSHDCFIVILADIEDCSRFMKDDSEEEWALARFIVSNLCTELFQDSLARLYIAEMDRNLLGVLLNFPADHSLSTDIRGKLDELMGIVDLRFRMRMTVGVSGSFAEAAEIAQGYQEATLALDYRMVYGAHAVIFYADSKQYTPLSYHYPLETEIQLTNYVKTGDFAQAEQVLEQIYEINFVAHSLDRRMGLFLFHDLLSTILKTYNSIRVHNQETFEEAANLDPVHFFANCLTAREMLEATKGLYRQVCTSVKAERTDPSDRFYARITAYIEENFGDSNLSLTSIAEHFDVTPQYMSSFFKKKGGQNMTDFIALTRIRAAKKWLADKSLTVTRIAQEVGYANEIGFIRMFKKYEGITPGKYSELAQNELKIKDV